MSTTRTLARAAAAVGGLAMLVAAAPVTTGAPTAPAAPALAGLDQLQLDDEGLGRVILRFDGDVIPDGTLAALTEVGVRRGMEIRSIGAVAVTATPDAIARAAQLQGVRHVRPQRQLVTNLYASREQINAHGLGTRAERHATSGDVITPSTGLTGVGTRVAVIDSGVYVGHPDTDHVLGGYHFHMSGLAQTGGISAEDWEAYAVATGPLALQDEIGHGTHVASTIGGSGELAQQQGADVDLQGVASETAFYSYKVATAPWGIVDDIDWEEAALFAFDHIIRNNDELGIDVTNNSWGLLETEPNCLGLCASVGEETDVDAVADIIDAASAAGITNVMAAGNDGRSGFDTIGDWVGRDSIVVAAACKAVDGDCLPGDITDFSSRGAEDGSWPQVHVAAPGDQIMAALAPSILAPLTECARDQVPGYFCISGTSMATPHVAGVALLMEQATDHAVTPLQTRDCLTATAVDMLTPGFDIPSGHGLVDARAAIACAQAAVAAAADQG